MAEQQRRIRILFGVLADENNTNSQSLTARELAVRLSPERFSSTFFFQSRHDRRLDTSPSVAVRQIPLRLGSLMIAARMLWGRDDVIIYPLASRATRLFWKLRPFGHKKLVLSTLEVSAAQLEAGSRTSRERTLADLRKSDLVYAVSDFVRSSNQERFNLDVTSIIPLGVDPALFRPADRSSHETPLKVLFVGSIQERKQPHLLLELARRFPTDSIEFHLIGPPLGDPSYQENLVATRDREQLHNVHFHGPLLQPQIAEWMVRCDLFVLPSRLEGLPKVTLEAAATGLPCIVFNDFQTPSVIDGKTGFQVGDLDALSDRLSVLASDKTMRLEMGRRAIEHARQFSWSKVCSLWEREMLQLMETDS